MSEKTFETLDIENYYIARSIWPLFVEYEMPTWNNAVIYYNNKTRKIKTNLDYIDWNTSPFGPTDRVDYFTYKYLGYQPKSEKESKLFKEMTEYEAQHSE